MREVMVSDIKKQFEKLQKKIDDDYKKTTDKIKQIQETMRDLK